MISGLKNFLQNRFISRYEQLVRTAGRPLAKNIYDLITHIEENIYENGRQSKDPRSEKAKVLRETKFLPKIILRIESFNKFVIWLSKKTKIDLSHLLHIGTVRDFRSIKTTVLQDVLNQTIADSEQIQVEDEDRLDDSEAEDENDPEVDAVSSSSQASTKPDETTENSNVAEPACSNTSNHSSNTIIELPETDEPANAEVILKNLAVINEKSKRKRMSKNDDSEVKDLPKRKRNKAMAKINKKPVKK